MRLDTVKALGNQIVDGVHTGHTGFEVEVRSEVEDAFNEGLWDRVDAFAAEKAAELIDCLAFSAPEILDLYSFDQLG